MAQKRRRKKYKPVEITVPLTCNQYLNRNKVLKIYLFIDVFPFLLFSLWRNSFKVN